MHWSLKLAAIAHVVSSLAFLVFGLAATWIPKLDGDDLTRHVIWSSMLTVFVSGFYIVVRYALERLKAFNRGSGTHSEEKKVQ